jgi:hypothetical protein
LDNGKLSENVLPEVLCDLIRVTKRLCARGECNLTSANQFFELVDLLIIWSKLHSLVKSGESRAESIELIAFALNYLKIAEQSIILTYIIPVILDILKDFNTYDQSTKKSCCKLALVSNEAILKLDSNFSIL